MRDNRYKLLYLLALQALVQGQRTQLQPVHKCAHEPTDVSNHYYSYVRISSCGTIIMHAGILSCVIVKLPLFLADHRGSCVW